MAKKLNLLSNAIIAESNKQIDKQNEERKKQGLKERKKFGEYTESTGGGTPIPKGKTKEDMEGKPGFHRVDQPRDEEGKFTYNSANGKGLKYGPSRGETKPPFLDGIVLTCIEEGTTMKTEDQKRILSTINMSVDQLIENCKHYLDDEKGFAGLIGGFITKKGRESKAEKGNVGFTGKQDLSKAGETTKENVKNSQAEYQQAESAKRRAEPALDSAPREDYNKAGVTEEGLKMREAWREMLKKKAIIKDDNPPKPPFGGGSVGPNNNIPPVPPTPVAVAPTNQQNEQKDEQSNGWDIDKAKNNPKQFLQENFSLIKDMTSMVPGMSASKAIGLIASGKIKSFEQFKSIVDKHNSKNVK